MGAASYVTGPRETQLRMRILILSQFFDPEPTLKGLAFARALASRGHQVEVLTGFPNYPGGKVYPGYKLRIYQREIHDGVIVHRVPLYPSHDRSALRRLFNYASFALSSALVGPFVLSRPDAIYVHHPPLTISIAATLLRRYMRSPYVLEIQDLWPDTLSATGMISNGRMLRVVDLWAKWAYRDAARIVVISPGFKRALTQRGVPAEKVDVLYNWSEEGRLSVPAEAAGNQCAEFGFDGRFNVVFAGTMGIAQGLDTVLDAARELCTSDPEVQFVFIGGGIDRARLVERVEKEGISNVRFIERQPVERIGTFLRMSDVALVHLRDDPLFAITVPSKTQAYMYAGIPIIMAVRGDAARLVELAGAGVACEPQNAHALVATVRQLAAMPREQLRAMGAAGRRYYEESLSLQAGVTAYERIFLKTASTGDLSTPATHSPVEGMS